MIHSLLLPTIVRYTCTIIQYIFIHPLRMVLLYYYHNIIQPILQSINRYFFDIYDPTKKNIIIHRLLSIVVVYNCSIVVYCKIFGILSNDNNLDKIKSAMLYTQKILFLIQLFTIVCIWFYVLVYSFRETNKDKNSSSAQKQKNIAFLSISFPIIFFAKTHYIINSTTSNHYIISLQQKIFENELFLDFI